MNPPLTTLRYDRRALGASMARSVMEALDEGAEDATTVVPLELLARGTT
jgi:DNA-binding LacI/PurR family transcriptional regulator